MLGPSSIGQRKIIPLLEGAMLVSRKCDGAEGGGEVVPLLH